MNTITFTRETFQEYKEKYLETVKAGQKTFVHKGSLKDIYTAKQLIDKFQPHFNDKSLNEATINYKS
jgi:hypothetical protein